MKVNVRVSGIVLKDGKVFLVKHEDSHNGIFYILPGGGLERDETIEECAIREVKEEIGLNVKISSFAYYEDVVSEYDHTLHLIFKCNIVGGKVENLDPDKKVKEILLVDDSKLKRLKFFPEKLKERLFSDRDLTSPISLGKTPYH